MTLMGCKKTENKPHKAAKTAKTDKDKAWAAFSEMIRVRDCLRTTGVPFVGVCITCDKKYHARALQAGHCFAGRSNAKLFMRRFVNAQCGMCNLYKNGKAKKYERIMRERFSDKYVDRAIYHMNRNISDRDIDWNGRAERYKRLTAIMLRAHGYKTWREMLDNEQ